jgi:trehalose-6-phosphate synthase
MWCDLVQALTLSRVERDLRQHKLYRYVSMHTACFWAKSFMQASKMKSGLAACL